MEVQLAAGLVGPFTAIARVMSNQHKVNIVPSGFRCETDGKTIWIPFAADHLPEEKRQALHGMLDHEVCHVVEEEEHRKVGRATPMDVMRLAKNKTERLLLNVVEDIRIERKWAAKYPGVAENLRFLHLDIGGRLRAAWDDPAKAKPNFWNQIGLALLLAGRGEDYSWLEPKTLRALEEVPEELAALADIGWVQDSFDLAERIYAKINRDAEETLDREKRSKDKKKKRESKGARSEGGAPGGGRPSDDEGAEDEEAGGEGADAGEEGEPEEGEDEAEGGAGDKDAEDEGKEAEGEGDAGDDEPTKEEVDAAHEALEKPADVEDFTRDLKDELEKAARKDAREHTLYIPDRARQKLDRWFKPTGGNLANYMRAKEEVQQEIGAIRAKQLAFIQTITRKRLATGRDAGMLDAAVLADVRLGSRDVFADIIKGRDLDTAIEVLLDLSGSMGDGDACYGEGTSKRAGCAYFCKRISIALAEAWEPLRIPNEFIGFTNNHARDVGERDPDCVARAPFDFYVFKAWGERLKACRERFTHIQGYQDNADGEAVWAAATRLAMRPEKRKILLVISDGIPMHSGISPSMLDKHLRETVKRITRSGIEVIGVGAGTDAPIKYYNKDTGATNLVIRDLTSLPNRLFNTMRERILGK